MKQERLVQLREKLEEEQREQYFICPKKCARLNFDQAVNFEFRCPECNELVSQEDIGSKVKEIKKEITQLEKELKKI